MRQERKRGDSRLSRQCAGGIIVRRDLLTADQLADRIAVKPRTVRDWTRAGLIPAVRLTRKVIRYDFDEVVAALEERQEAVGGGR